MLLIAANRYYVQGITVTYTCGGNCIMKENKPLDISWSDPYLYAQAIFRLRISSSTVSGLRPASLYSINPTKRGLTTMIVAQLKAEDLRCVMLSGRAEICRPTQADIMFAKNHQRHLQHFPSSIARLMAPKRVCITRRLSR